MRRDRRILLGAVLGAAAGLVFAAASGGSTRAAILSDCDGRIREIVVQWVPEGRAFAATALAEFLGGLAPDVTVHLLAPDEAALADFRAAVGDVPPAIRPVLVHHAMTGWAKDRWLARAPIDGEGPIRLLLPAREAAATAWPARAGDSRTGEDLARALSGDVAAIRSALAFDGGDFVADSETVFVAARVATRNGRDGLAESLARALGRRVVVFDRSPDHHAGMFLMPVGSRRILVGDPSLAWPLFEPGVDPNPVGSDRTAATQALFDAVAAQCVAEGYEVRRIPVVPGLDGRTWLSYVNVVIDETPAGRIVHLPVYRGADRLNDEAERLWLDLGYRVKRVDATAVFPHFGSLRCLVNILRRRPAGA